AEKARKAGDPAACLRLAVSIAGAEAALLKGWCLMDLNRPEEAALAFNAALSGDGKTSRDAAYGKSLAMLRVGRSFDAVEAAQSVNQPTERRQEVASAALAQAAASSFEAGNYAGTLAALDRRRLLVPEPRDLMLLRGWALIHTGQKTAAREVFTLLDRQLSSRETRAGLQELDPILIVDSE
ncbi:MAG: cellulose synthase, partial [Pannonibacter sp.]